MDLAWLVRRPASWRGDVRQVLAIGVGFFVGSLLFGDWHDGLVYGAVAMGASGLSAAYRSKRPWRPRTREIEGFDEAFGGKYRE